MKRRKSAPPKVVVLSAQPEPARHARAGTLAKQAKTSVARKPVVGTALVRRSAPPPKPAAPRAPLQILIEQTVSMLMLTATPEGDLHFRADVQADVMSDLSVDVGMYGRKVVITFYTKDDHTRRSLSGQERELRSVLESKGIKVHRIAVERESDPNEPPPVPVFRND